MINPALIPQRSKRALRDYISNLRLFSGNARLFLVATFFWGMGFSGFMLLFNLYLKELAMPKAALATSGSVLTWRDRRSDLYQISYKEEEKNEVF